MIDEFDCLRTGWNATDYEEIRKYLKESSLENLDIEQLTLLEYTSYEYQKHIENKRPHDFMAVQFGEEAFRSELRKQRRLKLPSLIEGIISGKQNIYDISSKNKTPYFLLHFLYRLTWQCENTKAIEKALPENPILLENAFISIESLLKDPSLKALNEANSVIDEIDDIYAKSAFQTALRYFMESALKVKRQASEFPVKCLAYHSNQGYVIDLIVSIYKGSQKNPIVISENAKWKSEALNVKNACFKHLGIENEINDYSLSIYVNDYPGTRESLQQYGGESVGLGIAVAILAFFNGNDLKPKMAFTGKIKPDSQLISKVGGFGKNGKACAACWYGIEKVIVPEKNLDEAKMEIERAKEDGAKCNTAIVGVYSLDEVNEAVFRSIISPKLDEYVIKNYPFPIAYRYNMIPADTKSQKSDYLGEVLIAALQYLSLILISQYIIRDSQRDDVRDPELSKWVYDNIAGNMVSERWGIVLLKFLRHYIKIYQSNNRDLFVSEFVRIQEMGVIEDTVKKAIKLHEDIKHNRPAPNDDEEWDRIEKIYTEALNIILEKFAFIADYHLIRIFNKRGENYLYHNYMGAEPGAEEHQLDCVSGQGLVLGQIYLASPDYTDFFHLHPMLIFWSDPFDVLLYSHLGNEEANYRPSFRSGLLGIRDYFSEMRSIYRVLEEERNKKKANIEKLDWEDIKRFAATISDEDNNNFDKTTYYQRNDAIEALEDFLVSDKTALIISGEAGSGKTSFLYNLYAKFHDGPDVSVLIYPGKALGKGSIENVISRNLFKNYDGNMDELLAKIDDTQIFVGRMFIMCIDAINEHGDPKSLLISLNETVQRGNGYPWLKMIITCRSNVWKEIKSDSIYPKTLYYQCGNDGDVALYLREFGLNELSLAYEQYRQKYDLITPYTKLEFDVRRMIKDPLLMSLIAKINKGKAITAVNLTVNNIYRQYIGSLIKDIDYRFLVEQLVPLMTENGYYDNKISIDQINSHFVRLSGMSEKVSLRELMYSYREDGHKTPYTRLLDAGILSEQGDLGNKTIYFRIERFYEFFLGEYIQKKELETLSRNQKIAKFDELITRIKDHHFLWGVIKQVLIMDEDREYILKRIAKKKDQIARDMAVDCLIALAENECEINSVNRIISYFIGLKGKRKAVLNAKAVAIQVARELCKNMDLIKEDSDEGKMLSGILERAVYDNSKYIRNMAYKYIYYLSIDRPSISLGILKNIGNNVRPTLRLLRFAKSVSATSIVSLLIYCNCFQISIKNQNIDQPTTEKLHEMWKDIIDRCKPLLWLMLWGVKNFSKHIISKQIDESDPLNIDELEYFFRTLNKEKREIIRRLITYFNVEQCNISSGSDFLVKVSQEKNNMLILGLVYVLQIHTLNGNIEHIVSICKKILDEGSKLARYMCFWALYNAVIVDKSLADLYRQLMENHLRDSSNWWVESDRQKKYCSDSLVGFLAYYQKSGNEIDAGMIDIYLDMASGNPELLHFIIKNMECLAIIHHNPAIALYAIRQIFDDTAYDVIRDIIIKTLTNIRIYYPDAVEEMLITSADKLSSGEKNEIRTANSSEALGHLFGINFPGLLNHMLTSRKIREEFSDVIAVVIQCDNLGDWLDQVMRRTANFIAGHKILKVMPVDRNIKDIP